MSIGYVLLNQVGQHMQVNMSELGNFMASSLCMDLNVRILFDFDQITPRVYWFEQL
jgi:hypothetical protein